MHAIAPIYGEVLHCQMIISALDIFGNSVGPDGGMGGQGHRKVKHLSKTPELGSSGAGY